MGLWAGIKHALNSSLGTKAFRPLDKKLQMAIYPSNENLLYKKEINKSMPLTVTFKSGLPAKDKLFLRVNVSWENVTKKDSLYLFLSYDDSAQGINLYNTELGNTASGSASHMAYIPEHALTNFQNTEYKLRIEGALGNISLGDGFKVDSIEIFGDILPDSFMDYIKTEE